MTPFLSDFLPRLDLGVKNLLNPFLRDFKISNAIIDL